MLPASPPEAPVSAAQPFTPHWLVTDATRGVMLGPVSSEAAGFHVTSWNEGKTPRQSLIT